ncbi:MAG: cadherin domain-containing protein [Pirellulaceae bacterium]|nr:cadherin domain-containing protein [Pirellulaceae bacterium]
MKGKSLGHWFISLLGRQSHEHRRRCRAPRGRHLAVESLESRRVLAPLPVLMVIADQRDFYYQEYGDTRAAIEAAGISVRVAATTTAPSTPHPNSGQGTTSGIVTPNLALSQANAADYSAIVFVGGWGSSMYQYAFTGDYQNNAYDGDAATKATVNRLISDFAAQDKFVTAICHGVTVLAWARVNGQSPLAGKTVSVPWVGSPAVNVGGVFYAGGQLSQYQQVVANGATANTRPGQYGTAGTATDDVVVDGRVITAENWDSAALFGRTIAQGVIAADLAANPPTTPAPPAPPPPANSAPSLAAAQFNLDENSPAGTHVGTATGSDPDAGQTLSYAIVGGNGSGAFAINAATGQITVASSTALDFETTPSFALSVQATDSGSPALSATATVTINLRDVVETPPAPTPTPTPVPTSPIALVGGNLVVQGTAANDMIYVWSDAAGRAFAQLNGVRSGPHTLAAGGHVVVFAGGGHDTVYATDSRIPVRLFGEAGNDQLVGGHAGDLLDGGDGTDRLRGEGGNDRVFGGAGNDQLEGRVGDDILVGGAGDDYLVGFDGRDLLIGGLGYDRMDGGAGDDLLIGGTTSYDADDAALLAILSEWTAGTDRATRASRLQAGIAGGVALNWGTTVFDDATLDCVNGAAGADWLFQAASDYQGYATSDDLVTSR